MKKYLVPALLVTLVLAALALATPVAPSASGHYTWQDAKGPESGEVCDFAMDSTRDILYRATTSRGVLKYQGGSWSSLGCPEKDIASLAFDEAGNVLYAGTVSSGVLRCDNPDTAPDWAHTGGDVRDYWVPSLCYVAATNTLYAGTWSHGVWRCDNPDTAPDWTDTGGGVGMFNIYCLAFDTAGNHLYTGTDMQGVWRCDNPDTAPDWNYIGGKNISFFFYDLAFDSARNLLYGGVWSGGVWVCDHPDTAPNWTDTALGGQTVYSLELDQAANVLYAGSMYQGAWRCTTPDTAPSWIEMGGVTGQYVHSLARDAVQDVLYAGTMDVGVWRCTTPAGTPAWTDTGGGESNYCLPSMLYDRGSDTLFAGSYRFGVWLCEHPATSHDWVQVGPFIPGITIDSMAYDPARKVLYAGTDGDGIWRCTNPATAPVWDLMPGLPAPFWGWSMHYDPARNLLYAGNLRGGVWRCANPDTTAAWTDIGGAITNLTVYSIVQDNQRNILYAGTDNNGVWRCDRPDTAPAWTDTGGEVSDYAVWALTYDQQRNIVYGGTYAHGIWRCKSPNTTPEWANTGGATSGFDVRAISYDPAHNLVHAGCFDGKGVWRCERPDTSPAWSDTAGSVNGLDIQSFGLDVEGETLFTGTRGGGAWYAKFPVASIVSCNPSTVSPGQTVDVEIVGANTGFANGTSTALFSGTGITVNSTTVNGPARATASITVAQDAPLGPRDVNVTTAGEIPDALIGGLSVQSGNWYLAEGSTAWGYETDVSIENPGAAATNARVTYYLSDGSGSTSEVVPLPAASQTMLTSDHISGLIGAVDFSTRVQSLDGRSIAVARTMEWTGPGAPSPEGHTSVGVGALSGAWYLAEGSSAWGFECWLLILNPNDTEAKCLVTYMTEDSGSVSYRKTVPAHSRRSFSMADDIGQADASIEVTSDVPVVCERSMYRNDRREGHCSIGVTSPATAFDLAEGTTAWGFTTYVLVQNPNDEAVDVHMTFMTPQGPVNAAPFRLEGQSRETVKLNDIPEVSNTDLSTRVRAEKPIIAERSMYWDAGSGEACHDSVGTAFAHTAWCLPDGRTGGGYETWTLVENPNGSPVEIEVTYFPAGGGAPYPLIDTIPADSRRTYDMSAAIPAGGAAVRVASRTAGKKIIAEQAMYWNSRGAGTDTIGAGSD